MKKGTKTADVANRLMQELTECSEAPLSEQECIALIEPHVERFAPIEYVGKDRSYEDYINGIPNPIYFSNTDYNEVRELPDLDSLPTMNELLEDDKNN